MSNNLNDEQQKVIDKLLDERLALENTDKAKDGIRKNLIGKVGFQKKQSFLNMGIARKRNIASSREILKKPSSREILKKPGVSELLNSEEKKPKEIIDFYRPPDFKTKSDADYEIIQSKNQILNELEDIKRGYQFINRQVPNVITIDRRPEEKPKTRRKRTSTKKKVQPSIKIINTNVNNNSSSSSSKVYTKCPLKCKCTKCHKKRRTKRKKKVIKKKK